MSSPRLDPRQPTDDPLRVVLWYRRGAGLHFSGPGRTAYRMYSKAAADRFRLTLVHGFPEHEQYDVFQQQVCLGNCAEDIPRQLLFIARARSWLKQNAHRFDVFHGLSGYLVTLQPALDAQRYGLPAVVKLIAWQADMADKQRWKQWLGISRRRRQQLSQLDGLIAISPAIFDELVQYGVSPDRIARIPNGVDVQHYRPCTDVAERSTLRAKFGWRDVPTMLFAGGINRRKRPELLVEALGTQAGSTSEWQLALAGPHDDPQLVEQMQQRASELGVAHRVIWLGVCQDMAPIYRAADVFCLPSRLEGLPNSVLEAMASGIPAMVTPIPGSVDLVEDGRTGVHIPADADAIAELAGGYFESPQLCQTHGQAARQKALCQYDVIQVLDAHEHLFRAVLSGQPPRSASLF